MIRSICALFQSCRSVWFATPRLRDLFVGKVPRKERTSTTEARRGLAVASASYAWPL